MAPIEVINSSNARRSRGGFGRWVFIVLLLLVLGGAAWTWVTLSWAYAEGERAGALQKFVRRGWFCKTREGEIALYYGGGQYMGPGSSTSPQLWDFSVRDDAVAAALTKAVGHRVQLHYTEHPGIPTECFAETKFIVDRVTITDNEFNDKPASGATPAPGNALPAAPQPAAPAAPQPAPPQAAPPQPAPPSSTP